ncbi:MAG TPA: hypothetical protein VGR44_11430, partial [Methylomirabilota bacterium]|nr:hypothetical protein [Methylomirabilota bacterium]
MSQGWRRAAVAAWLAAWMAASGQAPAEAQSVSYRLEVASLFESGFASFLKSPNELNDGASGPGLDALEAALDRGAVPRGPLLSDRRVEPVKANVARAYGAVS